MDACFMFGTAPLLWLPKGRAQSDTEIIVEWKWRNPRKGVLQSCWAECKDEYGNKLNRVYANNNETATLIIKDLDHNREYSCILTASTYPAQGQDPNECRTSVKLPPIRTMKHCAFSIMLECLLY